MCQSSAIYNLSFYEEKKNQYFIDTPVNMNKSCNLTAASVCGGKQLSCLVRCVVAVTKIETKQAQ